MTTPAGESTLLGFAVLMIGGLRWYYVVPVLLAFGLILRFTEGGRKLGKKIGDFNSRLILTIIYVLLLWPIGLIVRYFSDPLRIKNRPTKWLEHPNDTMDMQWAKRQ